MHFPEPWADHYEQDSKNVEVEGELNEDSKMEGDPNTESKEEGEPRF
jgi:hypothetical protein